MNVLGKFKFTVQKSCLVENPRKNLSQSSVNFENFFFQPRNTSKNKIQTKNLLCNYFQQIKVYHNMSVCHEGILQLTIKSPYFVPWVPVTMNIKLNYNQRPQSTDTICIVLHSCRNPWGRNVYVICLPELNLYHFWFLASHKNLSTVQ